MFARLYALGQTESGRSESGEWVRRTMVVETIDDDCKLIALDVFGQRRIEALDELEQGQLLEVTFSIEARMHECKWYNRINMLSVKVYSAMV